MTNLREAKRTSTRTAIEHAAWTLAASRPWAEITVDEIAAGAGVARRTFFNYFESKEQLLGNLGTWQSGALLAEFRRQPDVGDLWSSLRGATLRLLAGNPRESVERWRAMWREPAMFEQGVAGRQQLENELVDEICRRRPDLEVTAVLLVCALFLTAARVAMQRWVDEGEPGEVTDAVAAAVDAVRVTI